MMKVRALPPTLALSAALWLAGGTGCDKPAAGAGDGKVLASMDDMKFREPDFETFVQTLPQDRQDEIHKDPEARKKYFDLLLHQKLLALAAHKGGYDKNEALRRRLSLIDQRILTQFYYQTYLGENAGLPPAEVRAYYDRNPARFGSDSGKPKPFATVKAQVADSLIVAKANLDSFYRANQKRYEQKAYCELSYVKAKDKKAADQAYKQLEGGATFADVVRKYSQDSASAKNQGRIGRAYAGEIKWELGTGFNADSLFFREGSRLGPGKFSKPIKKDSNFVIVKVDSCQAARVPDLAQVRRQVTEDYVGQYRNSLNENAMPKLRKKYQVELVDLNKPADSAQLKAYYAAHTANYLTPPGYELYHIENASKEALDKRIKDAKDLEAFKKLAAQLDQNPWTKANQGLVGLVYKDHCLPYGIGMLPSLFTQLDSLKPGSPTSPYLQPDTKKWHYFWLAAKRPPQPKDFARALAQVRQDYQADRTNRVQPDQVLATWAGGHAIKEKDVAFLREEIPPHLQERYPRESLVEYLLTWDLASAEAKALGLDKEPKARASLYQNQDNFWAGVYRDSVVQKSYGLDTNQLKRAFFANRAYFTRDSSEKDWRKYAKDEAAFLALSPADFDLEYHLNPERYTRDSALIPFEAARYDIFQNLKSSAYAKAEDRMFDGLMREFHVTIDDPNLRDQKLADPRAAYKQAQQLHYDRKLDQAVDLYEKVRKQYPQLASLQDSVCFGLAQIYIEQEKYQQALAEYRRISYLYPKSPNDYKAMFMIGFIYSEHLKNDSAAVRSFEKMLAKYPKTDLSDDADWMIRNIRSGGKLMPVLEGDSGYVAADSAQAKSSAPSAKAGSKADSAQAKPAPPAPKAAGATTGKPANGGAAKPAGKAATDTSSAKAKRTTGQAKAKAAPPATAPKPAP